MQKELYKAKKKKLIIAFCIYVVLNRKFWYSLKKTWITHTVLKSFPQTGFFHALP